MWNHVDFRRRTLPAPTAAPKIARKDLKCIALRLALSSAHKWHYMAHAWNDNMLARQAHACRYCFSWQGGQSKILMHNSCSRFTCQRWRAYFICPSLAEKPSSEAVPLTETGGEGTAGPLDSQVSLLQDLLGGSPLPALPCKIPATRRRKHCQRVSHICRVLRRRCLLWLLPPIEPEIQNAPESYQKAKYAKEACRPAA